MSTSSGNEAEILAGVVEWLASAVRGSLEVLSLGAEGLRLAVGTQRAAVLHVRVSDVRGPSFKVSYPALRARSDGTPYVRDVTADRVLLPGLEWIVAQMLEHGAVRAELD